MGCSDLAPYHHQYWLNRGSTTGVQTLTVSLSPKHEKFIASQLQSGRYSSVDEMIALALELLEESIYFEDSDNKRNYDKWLEETRKEMAVFKNFQKAELTLVHLTVIVGTNAYCKAPLSVFEAESHLKTG